MDKKQKYLWKWELSLFILVIVIITVSPCCQYVSHHIFYDLSIFVWDSCTLSLAQSFGGHVVSVQHEPLMGSGGRAPGPGVRHPWSWKLFCICSIQGVGPFVLKSVFSEPQFSSSFGGMAPLVPPLPVYSIICPCLHHTVIITGWLSLWWCCQAVCWCAQRRCYLPGDYRSILSTILSSHRLHGRSQQSMSSLCNDNKMLSYCRDSMHHHQ